MGVTGGRDGSDGRLLAGVCLGLALLTAAAVRADEPGADGPRWVVGRSAEVLQGDAPVATRVGGWLDASYEDSDLDGSTRSLNLNHLNLFADTRSGHAWQLFVEAEFEHEPDVEGFEEEREYELEQLYVRYRAGDAAELRLGRFNTAFGFWTPVHWTILMDTIQPPLHEGLRLTPEQQSGLELAGQLLPDLGPDLDGELRYALFAGYDSEGALLDGTADGLSLGGDLRLTVDDDWLVGISAYQQDRDLALDDRRERSLVLYGQAPLPGRLLLRGEYVRQRRERARSGRLARDIDLAYAKLRWDLHERAYLNYRFEWGDDDTGDITQKHHVHRLTLGYRPDDHLRLKLEYADHALRGGPREDFRYWGVSLGYLF